jgi:uncharacterized surface protein with fasciclin (FAS1) repeats
MTERRHPIAAALFALPLGLAAAPAPATAAGIVETARTTSQSGQFQIDHFARALEVSGLADRLQGGGPYTVLAPTNEALAELDLGGDTAAGPQATARTPGPQFESADKEQLATILRGYIVEGELPFVELIKRETVTTIDGTELEIDSAKGGILVNGVEVLHSDIRADNGVLHVIGGLLEPGPEQEDTGPERQQ